MLQNSFGNRIYVSYYCLYECICGCWNVSMETGLLRGVCLGNQNRVTWWNKSKHNENFIILCGIWRSCTRYRRHVISWRILPKYNFRLTYCYAILEHVSHHPMDILVYIRFPGQVKYVPCTYTQFWCTSLLLFECGMCGLFVNSSDEIVDVLHCGFTVAPQTIMLLPRCQCCDPNEYG